MGFVGVAIGHGFGTIICAIYNYDAGCNPKFINLIASQIIHDLMGMITYLIVIFSIVLITVTSRKPKNSVQLTEVIYLISAIRFTIVKVVLDLNLNSACKELIQRIIEGSIFLLIAYVSFHFSIKSFQQI